MKVTVKPRQTLSDIAVQVYGDLRAVAALGAANGVGVTDTLTPGTELQCPEVVYDKYLQDYVRNNGVTPATASGNGDLRMKIFTEEFTQQFD